MKAPGALLAAGREADIFEYGDGLVLRRSRAGKSMEAEARIMEYVRQHGYPVPAIEAMSDDGTDLVMERINGVSMVEMIRRKPWTLRHQGATLADLHDRLHQVPAPSFLPPAPIGRGDRVLHLDLHPLNVMIAPNGPVVIDWSNASLGDPAVDVALAWVLVAAGEIPGGRVVGSVLGRFRALLVNSFIHPFDWEQVKDRIRAVVEWKVKDPHMTQREQAAMWKAVEKIELGDKRTT
jgi:aminoglycoside phosphotransferase (APT) family kinase protein